MSKALRAKKPHKHPCPDCNKPVTCWWADHGTEARSGDRCDDCLDLIIKAWDEMKGYYR